MAKKPKNKPNEEDQNVVDPTLEPEQQKDDVEKQDQQDNNDDCTSDDEYYKRKKDRNKPVFKIDNVTTVENPEIANENWFKSYWRPAVGWAFIAIIIFDFIIGPIGNGLLFAYFKIGPYSPWSPLTLQGGGLFYIALGSILGIYAFGRTQEKKEYFK